MEPSRFEALLERWQEGEASPEELEELGGLLSREATFRRALVASVLVDAGLYSGHARAAGGAVPTPRRGGVRRWEAAAAILIVALSALGLGRLFLMRSSSSARVQAGEVTVDGTRVTVIPEGKLFQVKGGESASFAPAEGIRVTAFPGSSGAFRRGLPSGEGFELARGKAAFALDDRSSHLKVSVPVGTVVARNADFELELRPLARGPLEGASAESELVVRVTRGSVDVASWGALTSVGPGAARTFGPPVPAEVKELDALLREASFDLREAIDRALSHAPGIAVKAGLEREDGRLSYSVRIVREGKTRDLELDPKTGALLEDEAEERDLDGLARAPSLSLGEAVAKALAVFPGRAVEAEFEWEGKRAIAEIKILGAREIGKVRLDGRTAEILGK